MNAARWRATNATYDVDLDLHSLPCGSAPDIGAFERYD